MSKWSKDARDRNEPLIVTVIDNFHVEHDYGALGSGYDLILYTCPIMLIEVKNPARKWKLTDAEKHRLMYCKERYIPYHIVEYSDQMADILSAHFGRGGL